MQQVNLYLPEFRPNRQPLTALHMLWGAGVLLVLLLAYSVYTAQRNTVLEQQVAAEQGTLAQLQQQVQTLTRQIPASARPGFDVEMARLQAEIDRREQIMALITQQNLGNAEGFSAQLLSMARQSLDSLQISAFSLQSGGSYMELQGRARQADQVPLYLQRLRTEDSFQRVRFGVLNLEREASSGALSFRVSKTAEEKP